MRRKGIDKERETGNPEVPLYFGEGLRRSLGNAAGCGVDTPNKF